MNSNIYEQSPILDYKYVPMCWKNAVSTLELEYKNWNWYYWKGEEEGLNGEKVCRKLQLVLFSCSIWVVNTRVFNLTFFVPVIYCCWGSICGTPLSCCLDRGPSEVTTPSIKYVLAHVTPTSPHLSPGTSTSTLDVLSCRWGTWSMMQDRKCKAR